MNFENIRRLNIAIVVWFLCILHDKMIWSIIACAYEEQIIDYLKLRFDFSVLAFTWTKWNNEDAATDWILRGHTAYALSSNVYFPHMSIINFYLYQQYILIFFEHTLFLVVCFAEQNYDNAATSCWWNVPCLHYYLVSNQIWSQNINLFSNEISYSELKPAVMIQD